MRKLVLIVALVALSGCGMTLEQQHRWANAFSAAAHDFNQEQQARVQAQIYQNQQRQRAQIDCTTMHSGTLSHTTCRPAY